MNLKRHALMSLVVLAGLVALPARSATIYVATATDSPPGADTAGCGATTAPCATIQFAYDVRAVANDEIRVKPGTYSECVLAFPPNTSDPPKPVRIVAEAWLAPTPSNTTTILTGAGLCDGVGANPVGSTVFIAGNGAQLTGFTIRGAGRSGVTAYGGVAITNNVITSNGSDAGGGIYFYAATCYYGNTTASITNNQITSNSATDQGGGVAVVASAFNQNLGATPPCSLAGNATVTIANNTVRANSSDGFDGGGLRIQTLTEQGRSALVQVSQNLIEQNTMTGIGGPGAYGYGGGVFATTFGYGTETIEILDNTVQDNVSSGDGGGISAWIDTLGRAQHTVRVDGNTVQDNIADGNGGGIDVLLSTVDLITGQSAGLGVTNNAVQGNTALGTVGVGGGGGILATFRSVRSALPDLKLNVAGNTITGNGFDDDGTLSGAGGGATLFALADSEGSVSPPVADAPAAAHIGFSNNLVAANATTSPLGLDSIGGGVLTLLEAFGQATASAGVELSTISDNSAEFSAGGIEVESNTGNVASVEGVARFTIDSSIVEGSAGAGLGGPAPGFSGYVLPGGTGNVEIASVRTDYFGNTTNIDASINAVLTQSGTLTTDPMLAPVTYATTLCGRLGRSLPASLSDANADDVVDGIEILRISVAFGSSAVAGRFNAFADLDGNGMVDGDDLAIAAMNITDTCP